MSRIRRLKTSTAREVHKQQQQEEKVEEEENELENIILVGDSSPTLPSTPPIRR